MSYSFLQKLNGDTVTVELKNGTVANGTVTGKHISDATHPWRHCLTSVYHIGDCMHGIIVRSHRLIIMIRSGCGNEYTFKERQNDRKEC